jgi:hypothetical protein
MLARMLFRWIGWFAFGALIGAVLPRLLDRLAWKFAVL